ncbi:hypothetical protein [Spiroplasma endosymbiont of Aspidapion aeneum]|uniref:hypothetical protein n=1 Tax=Spiroplasma endosymbiont of Aspidapion aeneum TaxID=3066276 RepID=UPI00313EDFE2
MNKITNIKFIEKQILTYAFKTYFKTPKTYLYSIFLPILFFCLFYLLKSSFGNENWETLYSQAWSLLPISCICSLFTISNIIINWRESNFISKIKILRIKKIHLFISFLILSLVITYISTVVNIICGLIIDLFLVNKNFTFGIQQLIYFDQYVGIFFTISIMQIIIFSITYIFSFFINSPFRIQVLNLIFCLYMLFFGGVLINRTNFTDSFNNSIISQAIFYINPIDSSQWLYLFSCGRIINDSSNIVYISDSLFSTIPYSIQDKYQDLTYEIPLCLTISGLWISIFAVISVKLDIKKL